MSAAGIITADTIAARRRALEEEEELGLVGLVSVDRILAVTGGIIGGALGLTVLVALELAKARRRRP